MSKCRKMLYSTVSPYDFPPRVLSHFSSHLNESKTIIHTEKHWGAVAPFSSFHLGGATNNSLYTCMPACRTKMFLLVIISVNNPA